MTSLLGINSDAKTVKGKKQGYLTGILYLAPANSSGINVCANASPACIAACLNYSGRNRIFQHIRVDAGFEASVIHDILRIWRNA